MCDDQGASPTERLIGACRSNNTSLLEDVLEELRKASHANPAEHIAQTLNAARDAMGNGLLHLAASNGNYDTLDILLDQEGLEIDESDLQEKDTPLHKAVRFANSLPPDKLEIGISVFEILIDAGCNRWKCNKARLRPLDLVDPHNTELRKRLRMVEYTHTPDADVVQDDDDGPTGSGTESE